MNCFSARAIWFIFLIVLFTGQLSAEVGISNEEDLKKRADKYYEAENFEAALPDYSRLLSLYPKESLYNFRFGVCLIKAGKEKTNAAAHLENASKISGTDEEVWYYLGKALTYQNEFIRAQEAFEKFKSLANAGKQKKFEIDLCIANCKNAIALHKTAKNVLTVENKEVPVSGFFNNYDFSVTTGRTVNAAEQFLTSFDKEKKLKDPVMYVGNDKQSVYLASYGKSDENGKDIYLIRKTPDNQWGQPERLSSSVNTPYDEDFPFLDRDGKTLFFSSKGHNSMGGYDLFKSVYNYSTREWSAPENLGVPINTPGDEFLFVADEFGRFATYSTNVESGIKNIIVRRIEMPAGKNDQVTISGMYFPQDQKMRRDARISILNSSGDRIISSVHTDPTTGKYQLSLTPGQMYMIVVEGGGYIPHAEIFELPEGISNPDLKQVVKINKDDQQEELTLENYFSSQASDKPSKVITRSYSSNADKSAMISVKINDQIVYVNKPEEPAASDEASASADIKISETDGIAYDDPDDSTSTNSSKKKDKYDPTLNRGLSSDQLRQKEEEESRKEEIREEESSAVKTFDDDVSNEELAKMAYGEAKQMQLEADSMEAAATSMREIAGRKHNLSLTQKTQSETAGLSQDSVYTLQQLSEQNRVESEELLKQADELAANASAKRDESKLAYDEANQIFKTSKPTGEVASSKKSSSIKDKEEPVIQDVAIIKGPPIPNDLTAINKPKSTDISADDPEMILQEQKKGIYVTANEGSTAEINSGTEIAEETVIHPVPVNTSHTNDEDGLVVVDASSCVEPSTLDYYENRVQASEENQSTDKLSDPAKHEPSANEPSKTINDDSANNIAGNVKPVVQGADNTENTIAQTGPSDAETENKIETLTGSDIKTDVTAAGTSEASSDKISEDSKTIIPESSKVAENAKTENIVESNSNPPVATDTNKQETSSTSGIKEQTKETTNNTADKKSETADNTQLKSSDIKKGEEPVASNPSILSMDDDTASMPMPVKEEVRVMYREYQAKINQSNELTQESLRLQEEISKMTVGLDRDAKIRESNAKTIESIKVWQEGLRIIQEARKLDSGVEYKMNVNDYARNNRNRKDSVAEPLKPEESAMASANTNIPPPQMTDIKNDPAIKGMENSDAAENDIDTTHSEYPKYASLKKEITAKQVQTIDVFAEAIKLNRLATEEQEAEVALMDQARVEKDSAKKSELLKQSFEKKRLSEQHAKEADAKFKEAQEYIKNVRGMKLNLAALKEMIKLKPGQNLTASAGNTKPVKTTPAATNKNNAGGTKPSVNTKTNTNPDRNQSSPMLASASDADIMVSEDAISSLRLSNDEVAKFGIYGFSKIESTPYSASNPIPMNPVLPEGLIFKVQIGAFRSPLPSDVFKGIQPISRETTRPGWVRYCAGLFKAFEPANIVKKEIQSLGYKDAFVVAYYNGKRIELDEAYAILKSKMNLSAYKGDAAREIAMLKAMNINTKPVAMGYDRDVSAFFGKKSFENSSRSMESSSGYYTVQVGVYRTPKAPAEIASIKPLQTVPAKDDLYRFTSGRFSSFAEAEAAKQQIVRSGIRDAFVVKYKIGVVINNEAGAIAGKPIGAANNSSATPVSKLADEIAAPGQVIYKVQIGAYRNSIPYTKIESYMNIIDQGITEKIDERGLHLYFAGKGFTNFSDAQKLLTDISSKGVSDAFVIAVKDGKRIPITDEMKK